jgi:hypothetical protein
LSPPTLVHSLDKKFQANIETIPNNQHPYNSRSKDHPKEQNKYASDANKNETSKQKKQVETLNCLFLFDLNYDHMEDFKRFEKN